MGDDPLCNALAALTMAVMHTMTDTQRKQMADALASTAEAAQNERQPKSAEVIDYLARTAAFVRHGLNRH